MFVSRAQWLWLLIVSACISCAGKSNLPDAAHEGSVQTDAETPRCPVEKPVNCSGLCVDPLRNRLHCGSCDHFCRANQVCVQGQCRCAAGYADCDRKPETGCEANLSNDLQHCTQCGFFCGANSVCANGCQCVGNSFDCDGERLNGCECSTGCEGQSCRADAVCSVTKLHHCGTEFAFCDNGTCRACPTGKTDCDGDAANGCECSIGCDGTACKTSKQCDSSMVFSCGDALDYCASTQCQPCEAGTRNCDGVFDCECAANNHCVDHVCVGPDLCVGKQCGVNALCVGGLCLCADPWKNCNGLDSDGCECETDCDGTSCKPGNPTACATVTCGSNQVCANGKCLCTGDFANCNGLDSDGCECASSQPCVSGMCIDCVAECANRECGPNPQSACAGTCGTGCGDLACNESTGKCYGCDPQVSGWCGDTLQYCPGLDQVCQPCPTGLINCDLKQSCECLPEFGDWCDTDKNQCVFCAPGAPGCLF